MSSPPARQAAGSARILCVRQLVYTRYTIGYRSVSAARCRSQYVPGAVVFVTSLTRSARKAGKQCVRRLVSHRFFPFRSVSAARCRSLYVPGAVLIVPALRRSVSVRTPKALPLGELSPQVTERANLHCRLRTR